MAVRYPLFVRKDSTQGTSPQAARLALAGLLAGPEVGGRPGVLRGMEVSGSMGWTYSVSAGHVVTTRSAVDGVAVWSNDGPLTVPTSAAPATGSRIDIIYVLHHDVDIADDDSAPQIEVAQGAPAGNPLPPALPPGAVELRRFTIPSGASGTQGGTPSDVGRQYTAPHGSPIPVTSIEQRDAIGWGSPANPVSVRDITSGAEWINRGAGWEVVPNVGVYSNHAPPGGPAGLGVGATREGRYTRIGNQVCGQGFLRMGSGVHNNGGPANFSFGLPMAARYPNPIAIGSAWLFDQSATRREVGTVVLRSSTVCGIVTDNTPSYVSFTVPWTLGEGDIIAFDYTYEAG